MTEPAMVRHTHPVAQMPGVPRCEANGARGFRWCRRSATRIVSVLCGDGSVERWRLCTQHANAMSKIGAWRTAIGEDHTVVGCATLVSEGGGEA